MTKLQIPQHYEEGLANLRRMSEDSFRELMGALSQLSPVWEPRKLSSRLAPNIKTIPEDEIDQIVETLMSLFRAQTYLDLSTTELAEHVCEAMRQSDKEALKLTDEECEPLQKRLEAFFTIEALTYPAKVAEIVSDHDRIFVEARVMTDIRAIFSSNPDELPKGANVVHMLNIAYQQGKKREKFYVALDSQDLESLVSTLQRALKKEQSLKQVLDGAGIQHVNPE